MFPKCRLGGILHINVSKEATSYLEKKMEGRDVTKVKKKKVVKR